MAQPLLQGAFAELLSPAQQPDDEGMRLLELLTPREIEVLVRVAEGEDTRLIAAGMRIAPSTARTHVQRVLMKLGVGSRLEAAALAARTGLLDRAAAPGRADPGGFPPPCAGYGQVRSRFCSALFGCARNRQHPSYSLLNSTSPALAH